MLLKRRKGKKKARKAQKKVREEDTKNLPFLKSKYFNGEIDINY